MTMPYERRRAVNQTHAFLVMLVSNVDVPKYVRDRARQLLKHYPSGYHMDEAAEKAPDVFGDWRHYGE